MPLRRRPQNLQAAGRLAAWAVAISKRKKRTQKALASKEAKSGPLPENGVPRKVVVLTQGPLSELESLRFRTMSS